MTYTEFVDGQVRRVGPSARPIAEREWLELSGMAAVLVATCNTLTRIHSRLVLSREFTRSDGRVIRLEMDHGAVLQSMIDAMELGQEAQAALEASAFALLRSMKSAA